MHSERYIFGDGMERSLRVVNYSNFKYVHTHELIYNLEIDWKYMQTKIYHRKGSNEDHNERISHKGLAL